MAFVAWVMNTRPLNVVCKLIKPEQLEDTEWHQNEHSLLKKKTVKTLPFPRSRAEKRHGPSESCTFEGRSYTEGVKKRKRVKREWGGISIG
jgi:hypothetical protein